MGNVISFAIAIAASFAFQDISPSAPDIELRLGRFGTLQAKIQIEAELRRVIGSDAGEIVRDAISRFPDIERTNGTGRRIINVVEEQLPADWLPRAAGIEYRSHSVNADVWKVGCPRVLWLSASLDGDRLTVTVHEGHQCKHTGRTFAYSRDGQRWNAVAGFGGGMAGGSSDCDCK